jgi:peptidoglycan/xylan/chitin deacetylase (PgdA/CDA1 family)
MRSSHTSPGRRNKPRSPTPTPPYGSFTPQTLGLLTRQHKLMVLWSVDTKDFSRPGKSKIIYTALSGAKPGAIILMHDGGGNRDQTAQALPKIVAGLRRRGFHLVTIPRLLRDDPPARHQPPPHPLSGP